MGQSTLVKRYSNRRLYDTSSSKYITLEDLAARLREGEDFHVIDAKSGDEITRRVLLQVVVLDSLGIADLLPQDFLLVLIRLREPAAQEMFLSYLRMGMDAFRLARSQLEENLKRFRQQSELTAQWMSGWMPSMGMAPPPWRGPGSEPPAPKEPKSDDEER